MASRTPRLRPMLAGLLLASATLPAAPARPGGAGLRHLRRRRVELAERAARRPDEPGREVQPEGRLAGDRLGHRQPGRPGAGAERRVARPGASVGLAERPDRPARLH